jgi:hypothetical protein
MAYREIQRIKQSGVKLQRLVYDYNVLSWTIISERHSNPGPKGVLTNIQNQIWQLGMHIENLFLVHGTPYQKVFEMPNDWGQSFIRPYPMVRFILAVGIEISVDRAITAAGRSSQTIGIYISIYPYTPENERIIEVWRERIEGRLLTFGTTSNQRK